MPVLRGLRKRSADDAFYASEAELDFRAMLPRQMSPERIVLAHDEPRRGRRAK
jgi:hypothetical protein